MTDLLDKCEKFLDSIPLDFQHEFESKYCNGSMFYSQVKQAPDQFVKNVLEFADNHKEHSYFQSAVLRHLGSPEVRKGYLEKKVSEDSQNEPVKNKLAVSEPVQNTSFSPYHSQQKQPNNTVEKVQKRRIPKPAILHTEKELKESIKSKLLCFPRCHDRFGRLTSEEKKFILKNTAFTKRERKVFDYKCREFSYRQISHEMRFSESTIKQLATRIDHQIEMLINS